MSISVSDCLTAYNGAFESDLWQLSGSQPPVSSVLTSTILFGFTTCLAFASIYALRTVEHRVIRMSCFCAIFSLYASTTCYWITLVIQQVMFANSFTIISQTSGGWRSCFDQDARAPESYYNIVSSSQINFLYNQSPCIQTAALTINVFVGDAIVWWRACSLWTGKTKFYHLVLCTALLLATFSLTVADTCEACSDNLGNFEDKDPGTGQLFVGARLGAAAAVLSLVTNLGATISIGYRTWCLRRIGKLQSLSSFKSGAQGILILFMESGILYCILWVFVATYLAGESTIAVALYSTTAQSPNNFWYTTSYFISGCLVPLIAIYPMAIIVIVAMKKSAMEQVLISNPPSTIPMTSNSVPNSTTSRTMVVNVNTETTTHQDSVIFIRDMYHKDVEMMECHTAGDVRESDTAV